MMYATILDATLELIDHPLNDDFMCEEDEDFDDVLKIAQQISNELREKVIIRWYREEDGMVAFWGYNGATIHPTFIRPTKKAA